MQMNAARLFGIAGVALGVFALLAPDRVERILGIGGSRPLRVDGAREVISSIGAMVPDTPSKPVWLKAANHILEAIVLLASLRALTSGTTQQPLTAPFESKSGKGLLDTLIAQRGGAVQA